MARGKETCRILKEIRRQIAEANDIEFITSECRYKGDCSGTCPKCESEVRYLEQQLRARSLAGKAVTLAGISAGTILISGCSCTSSTKYNNTLQGDLSAPIEQVDEVADEEPADDDTIVITMGESAPTVDKISDSTNKASFVDTPASFPGGEEKLMEWISTNLQITSEMAENDVTGRVIVSFIVKADGSITDIEVVRSLHPAYDEEAVRLAKALPKFIPATIDGKAVDSKFTLPVLFILF